MSIAPVIGGQRSSALGLALEDAHEVSPVAPVVEQLERSRGEDAGIGAAPASLGAGSSLDEPLDGLALEAPHAIGSAVRFEAAGTDQILEPGIADPAEKSTRNGRT